MDDKIKWALLAVGGYLLYDWYSKQHVTPAPPASGSGDGTGAQLPAVVSPQAAPAPASDVPPIPVTTIGPWTPLVYTPVTPTPTQAALMAVMNDEIVAINAVTGTPVYLAEAERRGMRYDFHQWNYWLSQTHGPQPDPSTYFGGDPATRVTAPEYRAVRSLALVTGIVQGLTGLERNGGPILPWSTAWRA